MAVGDIIYSTRYNNLQNRINVIMGTGAGTSGYGQTNLSSGQVSVGTVVTAAHVNNLRADMIRARWHQTGTDPSASYPTYSNTDLIAETAFANFETQIATIETDKLLIGAGQSTIATGNTSVRSTAWNGTLTHAITVDFGSDTAARNFFNSGGQLRFRATLTGGAGDSIYNDWNSMLTNMGTISMDYTQTTATGTGTGSAIGFYDLTTSNQQIFTKTGTGTYSANDYTVYARCDVANNSSGGARYVYITINFNDDKGPNPNYDENVTGTLTSYVEHLRATGSNVQVPAPTFTATVNL